MTFLLKRVSCRFRNSLLLMVLVVLSVAGRAQTVTGSVRGVITDPGGAIIPDAAVTATSLATGVTFSTRSNKDGLYSIRYLPIGRYTIQVTANGFSKQVTSPFDLEIDQEATIDVPMSIQGATANVTVNSNVAPILETENPTLGVTIDQNTIQSMPMDGRDFTVATVAIPGSIHTGGSMNEQPAVNGNRQEANSFLLDGMDIYNQMNGVGFNSNSGSQYLPSPDALQEMRVITSNATAEFGNVNGGQVVAVTKSGTNQLHGSAFVQLENYNMNANTWANKHTAGAPASLTPYTQTYFGGSVGGPILKDRLFFFADYQGYRYHAAGGTAYSSVIPLAMRNGDFSALLHLPQPIQLHDKNGNPFYNNQISTTMFSPVAQFLFANPSAYPLPNSAPTSGLLQNNFQGPSSNYSNADQGDFKVDWNASAKDKLSGRLTMMNSVAATTAVAIPATFPFSAGPVPYTSVVFNEVHVFSPNIINEARVGFGRNGFLSGSPTDPSGLFGTNGNQKIGLTLPQGNTLGFTDQTIGSDATSVGVSGENQEFELNTFSYGDDLSVQHGRHLFKMGAELIRYQQNFYYGGGAGSLGTMNYTGAYSAYGAPSYASIADFVLGYVDSLTTDEATAQFTTPGYFGQRSWRDGFYFQDDWKVKSNLTLNLGIRYDYFQPIYEVHNRETNINLQTGALEYAGQNGNSRALYNSYYGGVQPRIGFAYTVVPKVVVRGGYGISSYFEGMGVGLRLTQNAPWEDAYVVNGQRPSSGDSLGTPLPVTVGVPASTSGVNTTSSYQAWDPNIRPSESQEYSLTTAFQISNTSSFQVGYVGQVTRHLTTPIQASQWPANCAGAATCPTSPFASSLGSLAVVKETATTSMMNYNSLQAVYRQHAFRGLDITLNYTYSKAMTNGGQGFDGINGTSGSYYQQDAFNLAAEYGPSPLNATHNFSASWVYELPFGRDRQFASKINPIANLVIGGWKMSGLVSTFTGNPLTLSSPNNYGSLVHNSGDARPNYLGKLHIVNRSTNNWFGTDPSATACLSQSNGTLVGNTNTCAYSTESYTGFGTASNGTETGPGFANVDLSLFKAFPTFREQRVEFRADAFNSLNIANYSNPDTGVADATFGSITSTRNGPRVLQLSLDYHF
jgi:hypothetical protein